MLKFLKYLPAILTLFKDTSQAYTEAEGTSPSPWMSQRFIGAVITGIGGLLTTLKIVDLPSETLNSLAQSIPDIVNQALLVYGQAMTVLGAWKAHKRS